MGVTLKPVIQRNYLAKDFNSFRAELLNYARTYFADKINDFSEASMGGLFLDMAAFVGDSLSFYMDHQFNELNPLTAVETENIINHLRNAGVPIATVSPAVVSMDFFITVPYEVDELGERRPKRSALPVVEVGTIFSAANGVTFNMVEDLNFAKTTRTGDLIAQTEILDVDSQGLPITYRLKLAVVCISGTEKIEGFSISNVHVPFREIVLATPDVTQIIAVNDSEGNTYYEVSALTQDVVFGGTPTLGKDSEVVEQQMEIIPAPYRFVMKSDPKTKITTLQFGSGKGETLDDDIIPDPSELALPLYGKKTFHRFVIDPNSLLETKSLGISPFNTTLSVRYRHAGGLAHNVGAGSIKNIAVLAMTFRHSPTPADLETVTASPTVNNPFAATGGLAAPTLDELRAMIPASRQMQSRIVSSADLLARIYTLPAKFGRVYRAAINTNPNNRLASMLHVLSRDSSGFLTLSSDTLKKNISKYLNEFRLISDAYDVVDGIIMNFGVEFQIVAHPAANKQLVVQNIISRLKTILLTDNFQINQPIVTSDIVNIIINTDDVISLIDLPRITSKWGMDGDRAYNIATFDPDAREIKGLILPPPGGIFELKYPDFDIVGFAG